MTDQRGDLLRHADQGVYYFEHYLREGGVGAVATVVVRCPVAAPGIALDLRAELRDLWPNVTVRELAAGEVAGACDLLIAVFSTPHRFPLHDVLYQHLTELRTLLDVAPAAQHVMLYRAAWREVEVMAGSRLRACYRRRQIEGALIQLCRRSAVIRRLLRPLFCVDASGSRHRRHAGHDERPASPLPSGVHRDRLGVDLSLPR